MQVTSLAGRELKLRAAGHLTKLHRPQPVKHEKRYWLTLGQRRFHLVWEPRWGLFFTSSSHLGADGGVTNFRCPLKTERPMKRISPAAAGEVIRPALPATSLVLAKLPTLREFLTATQYDDQSARTPGYLWLSNRGTMFEVVLFNPDSGGRLPVVGPTLDDVLSAAETVLKAPDAPWQPDRYLMEQLQKKTKKKPA